MFTSFIEDVSSFVQFLCARDFLMKLETFLLKFACQMKGNYL